MSPGRSAHLGRLTPLEARVMHCVWELGEARVREVQERLPGPKKLAYNTVLTVMRGLREKGFLTSRHEGRLDVYIPAVAREKIGQRALGEVVRSFFEGSFPALVSAFLDQESLTEEELRRIRAEVNGRLAEGSGRKGTGDK